MKAAIILIVPLAGAGFLAVHFARSSYSSFNPTQQGREARAAAKECTTWTEILDRVGAPPKWRDSTSDFDFEYPDRFDETTRDFIAEQLKKNAYPFGFSFYYRHSDAVSFSVNFDGKGNQLNIQGKHPGQRAEGEPRG